MNKLQARNLIKHVVDNFKVEGTVFVSHGVNVYSHYEGEIKETFECGVFTGSRSVERMTANNFYNLSKLVIAKLTAMGLDK